MTRQHPAGFKSDVGKRCRVLVTGGAGFVGQHVIAALAERGHQVVAVEHRHKLPADARAKCCSVVVGDISDEKVQRLAVKAADRVCHLAAYIPPNVDDPAEAEHCYRVNALATLGLAHAAVERGIERFVYVSTANCYAFSGRPALEDDPIFPSRLGTYYFVSKLAGEIYLDHVCQRSTTCAVTLRIGTPYGPGEPRAKVVPAFLACAALGEPLRLRHGGKPTYNFVYVDDVANCVAEASEYGQGGIYNFASRQNTSLLELAQAVAALHGDRQPPCTIKLEEAGPILGFPPISVEKACRNWNLAPAGLSEGLRRYRDTLLSSN